MLAAVALAATPSFAARPQYGTPQSAFSHAERLQEALEGRPERDRIHLDYERVLEAYRAIYHNNPASPRADAAVAAVANLLAEEGRVFQDQKSLRDAIGQYEFLRHEYPYSRFRYSALITEGEIYQRDLGDLDQAKKIYETLLHQYPEHPLAVEARSELRAMKREEHAARRQKSAPLLAGSNPPNNRRSTSARDQNELDEEQARETAEARSTAPAIPNKSSPPASSATRRGSNMEESDVPAYGASPSEASFHLPPAQLRLPMITGIRHWSTPVYTRVAIDLQHQVRYTATRVPNPDRIYFDLYGAKLSPELVGRSVEVTGDDFLTRIRVLQFVDNRVRVVLDLNSIADYSAFFLSNPSRLIIDVHGTHRAPAVEQARAEVRPRPPARTGSVPSGIGIGPLNAQPSTETRSFDPPPSQPSTTGTIRAGLFPDADGRIQPPTALSDVATLNKTPNRVKATRRPTTAPIVSSVAPANSSASPSAADETASLSRPAPVPPARTTTTSARTKSTDDVPPAAAGVSGIAAPPAPGQAPGHAPSTMMRALGLKINRIVIDAGHGGHDSGTLGPGGLEEKDVVLDVALRLGSLLRQRLGAEVIYTRSDDTFIPLETRTAIANQAQADLFISIHANSSPDTTARGVEVYYLNFTSSADALEVAARENASSDESIHQLSDLVKKIALQDKINESREFAADVDEALYSGLEAGNLGFRDRGVKKAPFVVLIGANMPSILAEVSFLTNPDDAQDLREPRYRQRIAESLYRGVAHYVESMNGIRVARAGN